MTLSRGSSVSLRSVVWALLMGLLLWSAIPASVGAQQIRTINIQDETVYVDGQPLPDDQLPDSLDLEGVHAQYRFVGIQHPVIEINGRLFAVENGLTPVTEEEVQNERAAVVLRNAGAARSSSGRAAAQAEAAQRQYLDAVERSSRELYERLVQERRMEEGAQQLARAIRLMPQGPDRRAKVDTLRSMLAEIFELKQENRRREIERLQQQIRELERNIRRRAEMREQMIDRRLQYLIDDPNER